MSDLFGEAEKVEKKPSQAKKKEAVKIKVAAPAQKESTYRPCIIIKDTPNSCWLINTNYHETKP